MDNKGFVFILGMGLGVLILHLFIMYLGGIPSKTIIKPEVYIKGDGSKLDTSYFYRYSNGVH